MEDTIEPGTLRSEIREHVESELGDDASVRFIEDQGRLDVRVSDLGLEDYLRDRYDGLGVTTYGDVRVVVQFE